MMGVLTFSANQGRAERKVQVQGNSSMASNSALEAGYVEYVDNRELGLVLIELVGLCDLLWLRK
jgi:hypothetical protein